MLEADIAGQMGIGFDLCDGASRAGLVPALLQSPSERAEGVLHDLLLDSFSDLDHRTTSSELEVKAFLGSMVMRPNDLSVGDMAKRAGVPVSTLHFYEAEGLIESWRTPANHRRYDRRELRRVAIVRVALAVGVPLKEVKEVLDRVPREKAVSKEAWATAASPWADMLDDKIALLQRLRDQMGFCIGCGCLSLDSCPLYNPDDVLGGNGSGPRRWTGRADERV